MNSNDAYLLRVPEGNGYLWVGKGASEDEERGAAYMSELLQCKTQRITEGKEPGESALTYTTALLMLISFHSNMLILFSNNNL